LLENSKRLTKLADINDEHKSRIKRLTRVISCRGDELICAKLQLRSLLFISALAELIELRLVAHRDFVGEAAEVTSCSHSTLYELEVGVDISFAPLTSEWAFLSMICNRNICHLILILHLSQLCKRLYTETKWHIADCLETLLKRG
jgi:hypothetical protein